MYKELGRFGCLKDHKYRQELHDLVSLLAYSDPATSPLSHYLSHSRRQWVATMLNNHILGIMRLLISSFYSLFYLSSHFLEAHSGARAAPSLEMIVKQTTVVRDLLHSAKDSKLMGGQSKVCNTHTC